MEGPCYTLEDALQTLKITRSELHHLITGSTITPVVYTKRRWFLLFEPDHNGWTGRAACAYRGHLRLHPSTLLRLLDGEIVNMERSYGTLLEPQGILTWQPDCPYKHPLPIEPLASWQPLRQEDAALSRLAATPLPTETETGGSQMRSMLSKIVHRNPALYKDFIDQPLLADKNPPLTIRLFFDQSRFGPEDLRIPQSEIDRYQRTTQVNSITESAGVPFNQGRRENQLHTLLKRILDERPNLVAKDLWKLLQHDCEADSPLYDRDFILREVSTTCLEWQSGHGNVRTLQWESFPPLVSKLRKAIQPTG